MRPAMGEKRGIGRPSRLAQIEEHLGVLIEHHVLEQMAKGRTAEQIAACLKVNPRTLRRWLRKRGYRIHCSCRLVPIDPAHPGQSPGSPRADVAGAD